jgi:hypothetical protein
MEGGTKGVECGDGFSVYQEYPLAVSPASWSSRRVSAFFWSMHGVVVLFISVFYALFNW